MGAAIILEPGLRCKRGHAEEAIEGAQSSRENGVKFVFVS
jgi:hypothetical protein